MSRNRPSRKTRRSDRKERRTVRKAERKDERAIRKDVRQVKRETRRSPTPAPRHNTGRRVTERTPDGRTVVKAMSRAPRIENTMVTMSPLQPSLLVESIDRVAAQQEWDEFVETEHGQDPKTGIQMQAEKGWLGDVVDWVGDQAEQVVDVVEALGNEDEDDEPATNGSGSASTSGAPAAPADEGMSTTVLAGLGLAALGLGLAVVTRS